MMSDTTKVGARFDAKLNLGNYNSAEISLWVEDRVRDDLDDGKTGRALDRIKELLDAKIEVWAREIQSDDTGTE
jgi:hypothetical protein